MRVHAGVDRRARLGGRAVHVTKQNRVFVGAAQQLHCFVCVIHAVCGLECLQVRVDHTKCVVGAQPNGGICEMSVQVKQVV